MGATDQKSLKEGMDESIKRSFDIVFALIGIVAFSPLMLAITGLMKATQKGPALYLGKRTGRHGKPFLIYKFRSMVTDAETIGGTTTGKNDPRVTKLGSFLRRFKLDELPQFFNVLKGDMSFVGPRPEVAEYTDNYTQEEARILSVRPGITDLASLEFNDLQSAVGIGDPDSTFREDILPRKNQLRLQYVDERSLPGDLSILFRTVAVVASKPFRKTA